MAKRTKKPKSKKAFTRLAKEYFTKFSRFQKHGSMKDHDRVITIEKVFKK